MLTVAFLANQFPSPLESYVIDEIEELCRRGVRVVPGSVRRSRTGEENWKVRCEAEIVLLPLQMAVIARAAWLCLHKWKRIAPLLGRIAWHGEEGPWRRLKALAHTLLGACYAVMLEGRGVEHIHVHHGYFGSWIAMTAARLLGVPFSMTLYGSDLLLHRAYLDTKLANCAFCLNVSEFNRRYILEHYPAVDPAKLPVLRLGVDLPEHVPPPATQRKTGDAPLVLLAVGRLHPVKDHGFLVRACAELHRRNVRFQCFIVGDGPERLRLEQQIQESGLGGRVRLPGYVSQEERDALYDRADVVVLTSRSEGIPVVLMEAMARGKIVLAPSITGIPELVISGETGFLYAPGEMAGFIEQLILISSLVHDEAHPDQQHPDAHNLSASGRLEWVRRGARLHVRESFNRQKNVELFGKLFLEWVAPQNESTSDENFVLQQI